MTEFLVGTSGYSYKEWKGSFYPADLPAKQMLNYYGQHFGSVEINNTFYRMPRESVLATWCEQVGEGFEFVLKASRRITHLKYLKEVEEEVAYFTRVAGALGERRGPTLFQLPPRFKLNTERLDAFLGALPNGWPAAFEFRNETWLTGDVYDRLRARGLAVVFAETDEDSMPAEPVDTTDWGYFRLRKTNYDDRELESHVLRISDMGWKKAYVFFKHEDEGTGPRLASRFMEIARGRD